MTVAWRIQHHPSRQRELDRLLTSSPDVPWRVITDPDPGGHPSAWRTYRACLESLQDETHLVIAQDDVVCVPGFAEGVKAALSSKSQHLISFFHYPFPRSTRRTAHEALQRGKPFWQVPAGRWIPTVCLGWPADLARDLLQWAEEAGVRPDIRGDDSVLGLWSGKRQQTCSVTTLSLAEHPDDSPSLVASSARGNRRAILLAETAQQWISMLKSS